MLRVYFAHPCDERTDILVITIDGHSWLKKTYIGKKLAAKMDMDFLSTGLWVRLVALEFSDLVEKGESSQDAIVCALEKMKNSSLSDLQNDQLYSARVEHGTKKVVAFPSTFPMIGKKISDLAKNVNIVLDGRRSFHWIPDADVCFYFSTSIENRAALVKSVKRISTKEAMEYIEFRDSFEIPVTVPEWVIRMDPYDYGDDELINHMIRIIKEKTDGN